MAERTGKNNGNNHKNKGPESSSSCSSPRYHHDHHRVLYGTVRKTLILIGQTQFHQPPGHQFLFVFNNQEFPVKVLSFHEIAI